MNYNHNDEEHQEITHTTRTTKQRYRTISKGQHPVAINNTNIVGPHEGPTNETKRQTNRNERTRKTHQTPRVVSTSKGVKPEIQEVIKGNLY